MRAKRLSLLIVDDNPADAALLRRRIARIESLAVDIHTFTSAEDGRAAALDGVHDCVMLDYRLGSVDGLTVLDELRAAAVDTAVVMYSGEGSEAIAVEALRRGAQDYLSKGSLVGDELEASITRSVEAVRLQRRLAEQRRELEDFVSVVAHDLQQPLAAVRGNVDLIRDFYAQKLDEQGRSFVLAASKTADRMSRMIDALLAYSRLGRNELPHAPVDAAKVVQAAIENLDRTVADTGAQIQVADLPNVAGDEPALTQLFQNLIANAIKYRSDEPPVIRVHAAEEGDFWRFSVSDNGRGVAPEHHDKIMLPFRRAPNSAGAEGLGVGLATCKKIVRQHGGRIWLESALGQGATFHFLLAKPAADSPREVLLLNGVSKDLARLSDALGSHGYRACPADDWNSLESALARDDCHAAVVDLSDDNHAGAMLRILQSRRPDLPVIGIVDDAAAERARRPDAEGWAGIVSREPEKLVGFIDRLPATPAPANPTKPDS